MRSGWHQVAFERDLASGVTPLDTQLSLMAIRSRKGIRVFEATCPHRGAHLGHGGVPDGDAIICPFHGHRIGLGASCASGYEVRGYSTLSVGGMVFACHPEADDRGFRDAMEALDRVHYFVAGFALQVPVAPALVIENAFDQAHFRPVHGVRNEPQFAITRGVRGELAVEGTFTLPPSPWQRSGGADTLIAVSYVATAYSDGLVVSRLGGDDPYVVITAATPSADGATTVRLSIAVPAPQGSGPPSDELCAYLLRQSRMGIERDLSVWRHLGQSAERLEPRDEPILAFRRFVQLTRGQALE